MPWGAIWTTSDEGIKYNAGRESEHNQIEIIKESLCEQFGMLSLTEFICNVAENYQ